MFAALHWLLWLLALGAVVALFMSAGSFWDARVQRSASDSTIRRLNRPVRLAAWAAGVCICIALGLFFPLNTNDKREGRDCGPEFDSRGAHVECR